MSERHIKLCREMVEFEAQEIDAESEVVWPTAIEYSTAHPPELLLALWEVIDAAKEWRPNEVLDSYSSETKKLIAAFDAVEELTSAKEII